ncbi:retropepsin-like aspartic protease family protein [Marinagarivorans algicola]|uniref:retropepsin-like aspartic protease family protein n=1 Tax=Marinagarivorans algicola TaxID=1513270 RepID=UPI0006B497B5|nr:TIGR02281 family clan AA aspartic protease [Marinagarivorans algicola]
MRQLKAFLIMAYWGLTGMGYSHNGYSSTPSNNSQNSTHSSPVLSANHIIVKGLFAGRAVLEVNGQAHLLKEGKSTPEGITLLRATSQYAQIEYNGVISKLNLTHQVGANYAALHTDDNLASVQLYSQQGGHFLTSGRINNRWVELMIDTGATRVTLNSFTATQLGINFQTAPIVDVETAKGNTQAHQVVLSSVAVGDVLLTNVQALVIIGRFPQMILLGNSYLSRVNMRIENTTMTLQAKY